MTDTTIYKADAIEAVAEDLASALNVSKDETRELAEHALSALPSADVVRREDYHNLLTASEDIDRALRKYQAKEEQLLSEAAPKIDHDRDWIIGCIEHDGFIHTHRLDKANQIILDALSAEKGWIPFTRRPMTEEEQKDYPNCTFMFDCVLPDDGDEILVSNGRFVWMDAFCSDIDGCYLDSGDDIDEDMAWMPLPKPYREGGEE